MRSACGKSTTATMTKHLKPFSNLNKCSLCFWDQKGMSQCFRSPMKPFSCANALRNNTREQCYKKSSRNSSMTRREYILHVHVCTVIIHSCSEGKMNRNPSRNSKLINHPIWSPSSQVLSCLALHVPSPCSVTRISANPPSLVVVIAVVKLELI